MKKPEKKKYYNLPYSISDTTRLNIRKNVDGYNQACDDFEPYIEELKEETEGLKRELESLTPNGSEFHNNPTRCFEYIKERIIRIDKLLIKTLKERNQLQQQLNSLPSEKEIVKEVNPLNSEIVHYTRTAVKDLAKTISKRIRGNKELLKSEVCPRCKSLLVFPRGDTSYCEECGYPDKDFND